MIRSLRTGITGLRTSQVRMDTVGNNIANVNTIAFKRSRAAFNEVLGQQLLGVGRTAGGTGVNPSFIGQGVAVGSIDQDWSQGALENTNVATDLALNGSGYFVTQGIDGQILTRAGNFTFNNDGILVTSTSGLKVQAFAYDDAGNLDMSQLRDIQIDFTRKAPPKLTETLSIGGNLSATAEEGTTKLVSAKVYDQQGVPLNLVMEFTKTANSGEWTYTVTNEDGAITPVTDTVTFDTNGELTSNPVVSVDWNAAFVDTGEPLEINLENLSQYGGSSTVATHNQDGFASGEFSSFSIDPSGVISLNYTNGQQEPLYQIAISDVDNPNGLEQLGENFYAATGASGDAVTGRAGEEFQTTVIAGGLEMSNVDLANEFSSMIIAQRGYQASARVITTSDEILQETVQLKR